MPFNPVELVGGIAIGQGVGGAIEAVVEPQLRGLVLEESGKHPVLPPDVMTLAEGVAQGQVKESSARYWARQQGYGDDQFSALIAIADTGPGTAYAFRLWRRGKIGEAAFRRALKRTALEAEWIDGLVELKQEILTPAELAVMVQRGVVPDPGYLPVGPPSGRGKVQPMPVAAIDTEKEAAGSGYDFERMAALARIIGLPASPDLAARMVFRGIIDKVDFDRAISEGNTRNEWRDPLFEGFREILTSHTYAELQLRGYLKRNERLAGTAKHGMSTVDSDLLFDLLGRSIPVKQVTTGAARGGVFQGPSDQIPPAYLQSLQRGNLRPEYYSLAYANRYTYPSAFVLRALAEASDLTEAETHQILLDIGWPPPLAAKVSKRWATSGGTAGDPNVKKAQGQLWTRLHRSYIAGETDTMAAQETLAQLGIVPPQSDEILALWLAERALAVKQLTAAQVKKAYAKAVENPATGQPWTRADAVTRLIQMGYTFNDASTFLDE